MKLLLKAIIPGALALCACASANAQTAEELLTQGRDAFLDYNFSEAGRLYGLASKKAKRGDSEFTEKYDTYRSQLTNAKNFLERVEKIVIIDSISVPRADFFKSYRLPASSGSLRGADALPSNADGGVDYVFTNEGKDYKLWAEADTTGYMHLVESTLLTDGNWSEATPLSDDLSEDCDAVYPFMMADGVTLYYAANGENSIGGYDIMVATRDATDGSFLQPSNLGFPYNSPFDDYLLAIDELNGVGWWATDRNQLDDELTVYVFIPNELRTNYSSDEDDVLAFARIDNYVATQPEDGDYDELLATIRTINPEEDQLEDEFTLPAKKGKIYHRFDELPTAGARTAMKNYLNAVENLRESEAELAAMRRDYHDGQSSSLASQIRQAESDIAAERRNVSKLRSDLYREL